MSDGPVDLTNCDREPIHHPGAIQPHGMLVVCRASDLKITHVSQNASAICGVDAQTLLGQDASAWLPKTDRDSLAKLLAGANLGSKPAYLRLVQFERPARAYDLIAHVNGANLFLELEPNASSREHSAPELYRLVQRSMDRMRTPESIEELCRLCATQIRAISGFDRVMTYRFDEEWNGCVVAEEKREDLEPFLGLHYPASDIPVQARMLYTKNWLRFIADRDYMPSSVIGAPEMAKVPPLDMSFSLLRSVSPIHLEYLRNMGVGATMSVSLIRDNQLWGLVACHHYSPHFVPYDVRTACELIGQYMSLSLAAAEDNERREYRFESARVIEQMIANLEETEDLARGLIDLSPGLLSLIPSNGAAVVMGERVFRTGQTPHESLILELANWVSVNRPGTHFATDRLASEFGRNLNDVVASGMLCVSLSSSTNSKVIWFRTEQVRTVDWAGDPTKTIVKVEGAEPRLSPRGSFALWKQTVSGRSLPWLPMELETANRFREAVISQVVRRMEELALSNTDLRLATAEREKALSAERAARAESDKVNQMKDEFVATLSHELRTPLNAILGWSQLLNRKTLPSDEIAKGLEVIERNARSQAQMIEDLLDVNRIISGKLRLDLQDTHLPSIVESAIDTVTLTAQNKGVRIEKLIDPLVGVHTTGDPERLQQIVWNLLSNSVKFTPSGGKVQVILQRVNSHIELTIADTGKGIDPAFLPHVFERFRQADASYGRMAGGLGLGLSIVRSLVELHGGVIRAHSAGEGLGATFIVSLPVRVSFTAQASTPVEDTAVSDSAAGASPQLNGIRVLELDDDADARELVKQVLARSGCIVKTAASVDEALRLFETQSFDIVISDIGMPEKDGYAFIRALREWEQLHHKPRTQAIALSAYARTQDRKKSLLAGYQAHLSKPVDRDELITVVGSFTGRLG